MHSSGISEDFAILKRETSGIKRIQTMKHTFVKILVEVHRYFLLHVVQSEIRITIQLQLGHVAKIAGSVWETCFYKNTDFLQV